MGSEKSVTVRAGVFSLDVPDEIRRALDLHDDQILNSDQREKCQKMMSDLAVGIKPQQDYENLPGSPH